MLDKIQIFISLTAALVMVIMGIILDIPLKEMAFNLSVVICFSYLAGILLRNYIRKMFNITEEETESSILPSDSGLSDEDAEIDDEDAEIDDEDLDE